MMNDSYRAFHMGLQFSLRLCSRIPQMEVAAPAMALFFNALYGAFYKLFFLYVFIMFLLLTINFSVSLVNLACSVTKSEFFSKVS